MSKLGTIFSIAVAGAVAVGSYALYINRDKIGGAFSRGVENTITNPVGNYFDNLFKVPPASGNPPPSITPELPLPKPKVKPVPLNQPGTSGPNPANAPTAPTPTDYKINVAKEKPVPTPSEVIADPNSSLNKFQPPKFTSGYYYINYQGSKYDTQWKLTGAKAQELSKVAKQPGDALLNIRYLGSRKLSDRSFKLIGQANNYL